MKAILVMDMPECCNTCVLCELVNGKIGCSVSIKHCEKDYEINKPSWCPLQEIPQKYEVVSMSFERGYNACIDDILKDSNR